MRVTGVRCRFATRLALFAACLVAVACAAPTPAAPATRAPAPTVAATTAVAAAAPAPAAAATAARPTLPTSPEVRLQVGALPLANNGPLFIAQARGYYQEAGLQVELTTANNVYVTLPPLATGQLHIAPCASDVGCSNALQRNPELRIVADLQSTGDTERTRAGSGLVTRQELWDSGAVRGARDLIGRTIYLIVGEGSAQHGSVTRWLRREGVDLASVEFASMAPADQLTAMGNGAIEVGYQSEPLMTAGRVRGVHRLFVTLEEMNPTGQQLYLVYHPSIERLGPMVGERFMVAYLRGVRDYINAFEHGHNQDAIIDILTEYTAIKDPAVYRQIKYPWIDPNGAVRMASLQSDADLFHELRLLNDRVDLSRVFEDKYRQFAVQYLGEYQPPR